MLMFISIVIDFSYFWSNKIQNIKLYIIDIV